MLVKCIGLAHQAHDLKIVGSNPTSDKNDFFNLFFIRFINWNPLLHYFKNVVSKKSNAIFVKCSYIFFFVNKYLF